MKLTLEESHARIRVLEELCAEVYVAALELGLPDPLLKKLRQVAAGGAIGEHSLSAQVPHDSHTSASQVELKPLPGRYTVLVVDDDPAMLEVLTRILRREHFDLMSAGDGAEALVKAKAATDVALLVTDYDMPGLTGNELADRVREIYPNVKILFQSGFSDLLFTEEGKLGDGIAFLRKPFTARGLREAARMVMFGTLNP
ncbi:MAG: response regulator [Vicinamibacterales bacterium]